MPVGGLSGAVRHTFNSWRQEYQILAAWAMLLATNRSYMGGGDFDELTLLQL